MEQAACSFALWATYASRLRGVLPGKNKSDVIDAEVLSHANDLFALTPARVPDATELALRRAVLLRRKASARHELGPRLKSPERGSWPHST